MTRKIEVSEAHERAADDMIGDLLARTGVSPEAGDRIHKRLALGLAKLESAQSASPSPAGQSEQSPAGLDNLSIIDVGRLSNSTEQRYAIRQVLAALSWLPNTVRRDLIRALIAADPSLGPAEPYQPHPAQVADRGAGLHGVREWPQHPFDDFDVQIRKPAEPALPSVDIEAISARVHENWMAAKRLSGVTSRKLESGEELMVPYSQLSEEAKELDRGTVRAVLAALGPAEPAGNDLAYMVEKLTPFAQSENEEELTPRELAARCAMLLSTFEPPAEPVERSGWIAEMLRLATAINDAQKVEETNPGMYMQSTYAREEFGRWCSDNRDTLLAAVDAKGGKL